MESIAYRAVERLALAGERAGLCVEDMISLLNAGVSIEMLLELIERRLENADSSQALAPSVWVC
jgi:hypothetical protein